MIVFFQQFLACVLIGTENLEVGRYNVYDNPLADILIPCELLAVFVYFEDPFPLEVHHDVHGRDHMVFILIEFISKPLFFKC